MDELVSKLAQGDHPVELSVRPQKSPAALKTRLEDGFVHVRFTATRGGTELGVRLDPQESDWSAADFEKGEGRIKVSGRLKLNYVPVKCIAEVDLKTFEGLGHLEIIASASA
jgi:hypothetical protein